ncbi:MULTISPECIES: YoqO family protein [Bacillus cereus group]|uniref:Permease n=1 Tax=Bacillus wiedmannii TaxID=1890302 RepID=A0ABD6TSP4_9BACI|nr:MULTISPECIES: YoqO family protein [Bacillus cereus group]KAA0794089.1 permease [Bacillus sp. BB081]PEA79979.1 permease [Bacillus wiedmannii]PEG08500.1 permease [Bacillus wiedmannii]PEI78877.1 permease [Bacillus wiedmannii]PEJ55843.1 permease [Bacillus wiedmannii]
MVRSRNGCYNTINPKNGIYGGLMRKKIGFWGFIISCSLLIILNLFTNNEWISIIPVFGFVFVLLYNWDDMKQYSKKSIGCMIGSIIVICSFVAGIILIEGQKQMEKMSIFQEWMSSAKGLYIVIVVVILLRFVISIVSYILKEK